MKILLHVNGFLPKIGGKELVVHHLATQYMALGHEVLVAGPSGWRAHRGLDFGYPVQRRPFIPFAPADASHYLWMGHNRAFGGFDVVHAHIAYPSGYVAARTRFLSSTPLVLTPHGYDICVIPEIGFGMRLDPRLDAKVRYAVRHADRVTAISETIRDALLEAGAEPGRIEYIPNGVDLVRFGTRQAVDMRARLGFPPDSFLVTTTGNYHVRKGHEVAVDAIARLIASQPQIRLAIVGAQSAGFTASVAARGLDSHVKFLGVLEVPLPGSEGQPDLLAALLQQSQVYLSAGIEDGAEGLSLALLEGMAAGCAPLATRISGNRDIIQDGQNGLLATPGDAIELATALERLVNEPGLLAALRDNASRTVEGYGWRAVAERYLTLYESLVPARSPVKSDRGLR